MPEFILESRGRVPIHGRRTIPNPAEFVEFDHLDEFTQGYIEALFFTESDPSAARDEIGADHEFTDGSIPHDTGFGDLHPASLARIMADCATFQERAADLLKAAYGNVTPARTIGDGTLPDSFRPAWEYDAAAAGRDFWFTRKGHGVGFWDREALRAPYGELLAELEPPAQWSPARRADFIARGKSTIGEVLSELAREFGEIFVSWGASVIGTDSFVFAE